MTLQVRRIDILYRPKRICTWNKTDFQTRVSTTVNRDQSKGQ